MSRNVRKRPAAAGKRRPSSELAGEDHLSVDQSAETPHVVQRFTGWEALAVTVLAIGLLLLAAQPVSSPGLWWEASRGRQVLATGTLIPSLELLALEEHGEPNGMAAVLPYGLYLLLGYHGWMLWRFALLAGLSVWLFRATAASNPSGSSPTVPSTAEVGPHRSASQNPRVWWAWGVAFPALVALGPHVEPQPMWFDLLAIGCLFLILRSFWRRQEQPTSVRARSSLAVGMLLTFVLWANGGKHMSIGLGILGFNALLAVVGDVAAGQANPRRFGRSITAFTMMPAAAIGGCCNPVGWDAWRQSWLISAPWWGDRQVAWMPVDWLPLTQNPWDFATAVFVLLMVLWITTVLLPQHFTARARQDAFAGLEASSLLAIVPILFAWTCAATLPLAVAWLALQLVSVTREIPPAPRHHFLAGRASAACAMLAVVTAVLLGGSRWERVGPVAGSSAAVSSVAGLHWAGLIGSAGWGIHPRLDPRHLQLALEPPPRGFQNPAETEGPPFDGGGTPTIFADDIRSAGMAAWVSGPVLPDSPSEDQQGPRVQDVPGRAWVGGRLAEQSQLWRDLSEGRQMRYWREDGSPGGWWLSLSRRSTALLCFSSRRSGLIRQLEPSIWKPLSLESPVLVYARAGDPRYTARIVDVLSQRDTIDRGRWAYQPPPSTGSAYDRDGFGLVASTFQPAAAVRQAEVFLAMELPVASLRVLEAIRAAGVAEAAGWSRWTGLWRRCQLELADDEQRVIGVPSEFRRLSAVSQARFDDARDQQPPDETGPPGELVECCGLYRSVGTLAALRAATQVMETQPDAPASLRYAAAWWSFELGLLEDAERLWARLIEEPAVEPAVEALARGARKRLGLN